MSDDVLGSPDWERYVPGDARYQQLHRGVRLEPETVWDDLRAYLCEGVDPSGNEAVDLVEDLMFWHADAFIDRLEALVDDCPAAAVTVAWAFVGGRAATPALERFYTLQERLLGELEREGLIERG